MDSLVVGQGCDIEGLRSPWAQGDRVRLLLGHQGSAVRLVDVQAQRGG